MKRRERPVFIIFVAIFLLLIFFEPAYGWQMRRWLSPVAGTANASGASLATENESLKAQLAVLSSVAAQIPQAPDGYIRAMVYSRYPMNFKNELLVNAGENEGVIVGKAVTFQGIFIGTVEKVFADTSLVQTVFDDNFKMAVRGGKSGYDALLLGGAAPHLGSIMKTAPVAPGDIAYTASPDAPYGLPVAIVAATSSSNDNLFTDASLGFAYDVNTIQTVAIER